jgi:hypothetical protein
MRAQGLLAGTSWFGVWSYTFCMFTIYYKHSIRFSMQFLMSQLVRFGCLHHARDPRLGGAQDREVDGSV